MGDYKVGLVTRYQKDITSGESIDITINSADINQLNLPRKNWNVSHLQDSLIWIGGGGSYLINNRYLTLVKRSPTAPSNPDKLTILTGLSDSEEEWLKPSLMKRELYEEVILLNHQGHKFYFPSIDKRSYAIIQNSLKGTPYEDYSGEETPSQWISALENDTITVQNGTKDIVTCGLIHLNGNHINLLFCCQFLVNFPLDQINFFDSEFMIVNGEKKFLNRMIYFYDFKENIVLNENFSQERDYEFTPHAEFIINKLKINWR